MALRKISKALADATLSGGAMLHSATGDLPIRIGLDDPIFAVAAGEGTPERAVDGTITFTRATTATTLGYAADAVAGASQTLLTCAVNERRRQGWRRVSEGVWSDELADGSAIPAAELLGYLAEGARTNLLLQSQTFDNAAWSKSRSTVTANATAAPDGTLTAEKLVEDTASNTHLIQQLLSKSASALTYTYSVFAKAGERTRFALLLDDSPSNGGYVGFDLAGGQVAFGPTGKGTPFTSMSATITDAGNGWYRCTFTATTNTATSLVARIYLDNGSGTAAESLVFSGDGTSGLYLFGAQLEQASSASSYVATTTAAVTRAADVLSYPSANLLAAKGTISAEITTAGIVASTYIISASGGEAPLYLSSGTLLRSFDGTNDTGGKTLTPSATTPQKVAATWGGAASTVYVNGSGATPTAFDGAMFSGAAIFLGRSNGASSAFGTTRDLRFYDYEMTAAQAAQDRSASILTGTARWTQAMPATATLKGVAVPGNLARGLSATVDQRRVRVYYSLDGGATRTELVPGKLDYDVDVGGETVTLDLDFANESDGARAQGWVGGGAVTIFYDNPSIQDTVTVTVVEPETITITVGS